MSFLNAVAFVGHMGAKRKIPPTDFGPIHDGMFLILAGLPSYSVAGVILLLDCEFDAFHADLQDAGGRRVVLDRHPPVGGNLGKQGGASLQTSGNVVHSVVC